ncbi:MAG: TRAP transporter substrate-binding protein DctP [Deltaproteobacteria bacterium]|nr:TRAP transporter substrate-binding protein DctP [Deltaproteobacteria bacterium]MBW2072933.1 TRAP transporter substrate-binding protein DctP [Deltaproteobacteria bacterium]
MNISRKCHRDMMRRPRYIVRNQCGILALVLALSLGLSWGKGYARPLFEIKLATLAPENSSLMKIFRQMDGELRRQTEDRLGFKIFSGFSLGGERDIFRKMRIGLIHAATFTSTALATVNPTVRVLQIPFLFDNYREVDYILEKEGPELRRGFREKGYEVLGWTEVGFIYIMTTVPIASVEDLKGKKVWTRANSPLANAVFRKARVSPVAIGAPDVLVALQTNLLQVVYNSPYYALITQWYSRIKYLTDLPLTYIGGALIMNSKTFSRLSAADQKILREVCARYTRLLTEKTREDNSEALRVILRHGVKKISPEPAEIARFKDLLNQAVRDLGSKYMPQATFERVREELQAFRSGEKKAP